MLQWTEEETKMKHRSQIRVRYSETDKMGVVYHSRFLEYFESARVEALRSHGLSYAQVEKEGVLMPVVSVSVNYLKPALYDELLDIEIEISDWDESKTSIPFTCRTFNEKNELLNQGTVVLACVNARTFKVCAVPPALKEILIKA